MYGILLKILSKLKQIESSAELYTIQLLAMALPCTSFHLKRITRKDGTNIIMIIIPKSVLDIYGNRNFIQEDKDDVKIIKPLPFIFWFLWELS